MSNPTHIQIHSYITHKHTHTHSAATLLGDGDTNVRKVKIHLRCVIKTLLRRMKNKKINSKHPKLDNLRNERKFYVLCKIIELEKTC